LHPGPKRARPGLRRLCRRGHLVRAKAACASFGPSKTPSLLLLSAKPSIPSFRPRPGGLLGQGQPLPLSIVLRAVAPLPSVAPSATGPAKAPPPRGQAVAAPWLANPLAPPLPCATRWSAPAAPWRIHWGQTAKRGYLALRAGLLEPGGDRTDMDSDEASSRASLRVVGGPLPETKPLPKQISPVLHVRQPTLRPTLALTVSAAYGHLVLAIS